MAAVWRLVVAYVALRYGGRGAGLEWRAAAYLRTVEDLRMRLTRIYWVEVKEQRK